MDSQNQLAKQFKGFINTPSLFKKLENFELFLFADEQSEDLEISITPEKLVLGKRVELFFRDYTKNSRRYSILAANLQVIANKVTLGELDFLIKDKFEDQNIHIELVYKFYLYDPVLNGNLQRWIGPNRRDTLMCKINKLQKNQLPLLHNKATQPYLNELNLSSKEFIQQVCFLGKLYVPVNLYGTHFPKINNNCIVGFWLTLETLLSRHQGNELYCLPKKENWLIQPENSNVWISLDESLYKINASLNNKKSILCWKKTSLGGFEQFFIVWW